jgi:hypothetical protein
VDASRERRQGVELVGLPAGEGPVADVTMTGHDRPVDERDEGIGGEWPVHREAITEVRRCAVLEKVAGEQDPGVVDEHDDVAVGVTTAQVAGLDIAPHLVHQRALLKGNVGRVDDHLAQLRGQVGCLEHHRGAHPLTVGSKPLRAPGVAPDGCRPEHPVAERVVVVEVCVDDRHHRERCEATYLASDLASLVVGGAGIDHHDTLTADDHADVLVIEREPQHIHAAGDLGARAAHRRGWYVTGRHC